VLVTTLGPMGRLVGCYCAETEPKVSWATEWRFLEIMHLFLENWVKFPSSMVNFKLIDASNVEGSSMGEIIH